MVLFVICVLASLVVVDAGGQISVLAYIFRLLF